MSHAVSANSNLGSPSHRMGIWWFLASEIVVFGGLVVCYLLMLFRHPEWAAEAQHTLFAIGTLNTVVLLSSSLTVILAHHAIEENHLGEAKKFVLATLILGVMFACFKSYEYYHEIHEGLVPAKSLFWSFYFMMTGLHMLHVVGGLVAFIFVYKELRHGRNLQRVESVGIYWHFVDVVWIFLYPLLYIASGGGVK